MLLAANGISPGSDCGQSFIRYLSLLEKWNARINLTGSNSWKVIGPLFEEAIWAAGRYPDEPKTHLDIGSGAGFPALPMRIINPHMRLRMIESRTKRAIFLETVVRELALEDTQVFNVRLEDYLLVREEQRLFDCVSWKALKLNRHELSLLLDRCGENTEYWIFHGKHLPTRDPEIVERAMRLYRREACPARRTWFVSIYRKNPA